jgi:O6-methylguanine-DNA--protein-cysteine methyltransferase
LTCRAFLESWLPPGAELVEDQDAITGALTEIKRVIVDPGKPLELALDLHDSEAERAVWAALRVIPAGETRTYS